MFPRSIAGVPSSQAVPGYLITAVCVPDVIGALTVWIQKKKMSAMPMPLPYYLPAQNPPCPLPQATTIGGGLPLRRAAAATKFCARRRRLCLFSCSPPPTPCSDKTSHSVSHPHNALAPYNTSFPPSCLPTLLYYKDVSTSEVSNGAAHVTTHAVLLVSSVYVWSRSLYFQWVNL